MKLGHQKRISSQILKVGENKVWFDPARLPEIKEAITKADIRALIQDYAIQSKPKNSQSRARARKTLKQKRKGRQKGAGTRKGKRTARQNKKETWMAKVRLQRKLIKTLRAKDMLKEGSYKNLYSKVKGGMFRSKRHLQLFLTEKGLIKEAKKK